MSTGRFFETATIDTSGDNWVINLDGRPVRTPAGHEQLIPVQALAVAIADEWNKQGDKIVPATMPLCGLINAAIDRVALQRETFINQIEEFSKTDLVCYWSEEPPILVKRQFDTWQPLLDWMKSTFKAEFNTSSKIVHVAQPEQSISLIRAEVEKLNDFELGAFTDMAMTLGSVIIGLALFHNQLTTDQAFKAAYLDELFQIEKWGEDYEAMERHKNLRADLDATVGFLTLLRSN